MFEQIREDWKTYDPNIWRQGFWAMCVCRFESWRYRIRPPWLRKPFLLHYKLLRTASQMAHSIKLPSENCIARGLPNEHFGGIINSCHQGLDAEVIQC